MYASSRTELALTVCAQVVVIQQYDDGNREKPFPHLLVAGVERYPLKVTRSMGAKKLAKRSKVKPFIKVGTNIHARRHTADCFL